MRRSSTSPPTVEGWPPLYLSPVPREDILRGDGLRVCDTIEAFCTISKDTIAGRAGEPLRLRGWQRQLIYRIFARRPDGRRRHRTAMIGTPRKNGKSGLASGFALDGLLFDVVGAEVYSAAAEKEQARIVFSETKRTVLASDDLAELIEPMKDVLIVKASGSIYRCLSAEAYSKEGLNPSRNIVDELHAHQTRELFDVLTQGTGARLEPMTFIVTTAGVMTDVTGEESICYQLYKHGVAVANGDIEDPSFFFAWWGAPDGADHRDEAVWRAANPGYEDIVSAEDIRDALRKPENEFRIKRLNQWVTDTQAFLPAGTWDACTAEREITRTERVVLGFDGSHSGDSTAIVGCTVSDKPHLFVVGAWEKPRTAESDWRVPVLDVEETLRQFCKTHRVVEIAADPYRWARSLEQLLEEGLPAVEFPQTPARMAPATQRFYEAVVDGLVTHDGDPRFARHVVNCRTKNDSRGYRVTKETKMSPLKIDLAVAGIMALDAASRVTTATPGIFVFSRSELGDE